MMRYGIPRYRLPRDVLDAEVQRIVDLGVTLELDTPVTDLAAVVEQGAFDAVFLAVGAQIGKRAYIPAGSAAHVVDAISLLHDVEEGGSAPAWSPGRRLRRRQHRNGRGAQRDAAGCLRGDRCVSADQGQDARA